MLILLLLLGMFVLYLSVEDAERRKANPNAAPWLTRLGQSARKNIPLSLFAGGALAIYFFYYKKKSIPELRFEIALWTIMFIGTVFLDATMSLSRKDK